MGNLTKKGAQAVTGDLDRIASLFQQDCETLGVPRHIAMDFAERCDMLSDHIDARVGAQQQGFDPEEIGVGKAGPLEDEPDEPYMRGEFTQQENRELREKEQSGRVAPPETAPDPPRPGVQAALAELTKAAADMHNPTVERAIRLALTVAKAAADEDEDDAEGDGDAVEGGKKAADHGYRLDA